MLKLQKNPSQQESVPRGFSVKKVFTFLAFSFGLMATPASADIELTFGTYAADKPTEVVRQFKPFLDYLSRKMTAELGEPVSIKMKIEKEYQASIESLATGAVDFSRFGPASYVTAHNLNPDIQIVAMETKKGSKRFNGVIAVHQNSQLSSLTELNGESFAFGDSLSTIGRYLAQKHLLDAGISSAGLSDYEYLGRHDLVGTAVGNKKFTAGALKESTFKKLIDQGVEIRALMMFENVTKPWIASSDVPNEVIEAMRTVMLQATDAEVLAEIAKDGFVLGTDSDYDIIRDAMKASEKF